MLQSLMRAAAPSREVQVSVANLASAWLLLGD
jgi:hypothetical protein